MAGPVEEVGQTARQVVSGLSTTAPAMLAIIVMQIVTLGLTAYVFVERQKSTAEQFKLIFDRCVPAASRPAGQ